jgi:hypothetical protein
MSGEEPALFLRPRTSHSSQPRRRIRAWKQPFAEIRRRRLFGACPIMSISGARATSASTWAEFAAIVEVSIPAKGARRVRRRYTTRIMPLSRKSAPLFAIASQYRNSGPP